MRCNAEAFKRVDAARKLLLETGFLSPRENTKVEQRIRRWVRDSGLKPDEIKREASDEQRPTA